MNIEVIVPSTSCYTLCASHSGKLLSEATEVDSIIYYNNQAIGQNNTEIANAASPKLFSFHRNFQLQIQDATQIVAGQTYTTTITWTLSDAP